VSATGGDERAEAPSTPTEEELRAAYEAEIKRIRVEHVLLENVVTLVNLGMRRTGLSPGTESERDVEQVSVAIDAIRALMPLLERSAPDQAGPIRDALSQLQLAFVRIGGGAARPAAADEPQPGEAEPPSAAPTPPGARHGAPSTRRSARRRGRLRARLRRR
jgi:hypothetical protein